MLHDSLDALVHPHGTARFVACSWVPPGSVAHGRMGCNAMHGTGGGQRLRTRVAASQLTAAGVHDWGVCRRGWRSDWRAWSRCASRSGAPTSRR